MIGSAPCRCGYYHWQVPLTGQRAPDGEGGWNWRVADNFNCENCGEVLVWLHEPSPEALVIPPEALKALRVEAT